MRQLFLSAIEASIVLSVTPEHVYRECAAGKFPGAKKIDGKWRIPRTADKRFMVIQKKSDLEALHDIQASIPVPKQREAMQRLGMLRECEKFVAAHLQNGGKRTDALAIFAQQNGINLATLYRRINAYKNYGIFGLVDTRGGNQYERPISEEAWEYFKALYLTQEQRSIKLCWLMTDYLNDTENHGWKVPGLPAMRNIVKRDIPLPVQVLHRDGLTAYTAKCESYIEIDYDSVQPGQVWVGDHCQLNCWIRHRGAWVRPWITGWMDMRSRCVVGWHINAGPNQETILFAAKRGMLKYGPPESAKIDNGRDYDAQMWTGTTKAQRKALRKGYLDEQIVAGIYSMLGIGVSFAIPYNARSKSIERFFDTLDCQFVKTIPTYCGKDTKRKPESLDLNNPKTIEDAHDLESFTELIGEYIETVYNQAPHTGRGMNEQTPLAAMESRETKRVASEESLHLILRSWSKELVVGKNGVKFRGMLYGQYDWDLHQYQGETVRLAVDPDDLRSVDVYRAETMTLLTRATQNTLVAYGGEVADEHLREGMRQGRRAKKAVKQIADHSLTANMDIPTLAIRAMQHANEKNRTKPDPTPKTPRIRPVRTVMDDQVERHKQLKKAVGAETDENMDFDLDMIAGPCEEDEDDTLDFDISKIWARRNSIEGWLDD